MLKLFSLTCFAQIVCFTLLCSDVFDAIFSQLQRDARRATQLRGPEVLNPLG